MLQRHVQVGHDLLLAGHDLDQLVADVAGIGVHEPQPLEIVAGAIADGREQPGQTVGLAPVAAVVGGVLGHDHQFLGAGPHQAVDLVDDGFDGPAVQLALEGGDGAEGAGRVAAVGNLEIGAAALDRRARHGRFKIGVRIAQQRVALKIAPARAAADALQQLQHLHPAPCAQQAVDLGHAFQHFVAVALGQAAGGDQDLVAVACRRPVPEARRSTRPWPLPGNRRC